MSSESAKDVVREMVAAIEAGEYDHQLMDRLSKCKKESVRGRVEKMLSFFKLKKIGSSSASNSTASPLSTVGHVYFRGTDLRFLRAGQLLSLITYCKNLIPFCTEEMIRKAEPLSVFCLTLMGGTNIRLIRATVSYCKHLLSAHPASAYLFIKHYFFVRQRHSSPLHPSTSTQSSMTATSNVSNTSGGFLSSSVAGGKHVGVEKDETISSEHKTGASASSSGIPNWAPPAVLDTYDEEWPSSGPLRSVLLSACSSHPSHFFRLVQVDLASCVRSVTEKNNHEPSRIRHAVNVVRQLFDLIVEVSLSVPVAVGVLPLCPVWSLLLEYMLHVKDPDAFTSGVVALTAVLPCYQRYVEEHQIRKNNSTGTTGAGGVGGSSVPEEKGPSPVIPRLTHLFDIFTRAVQWSDLSLTDPCYDEVTEMLPNLTQDMRSYSSHVISSRSGAGRGSVGPHYSQTPPPQNRPSFSPNTSTRKSRGQSIVRSRSYSSEAAQNSSILYGIPSPKLRDPKTVPNEESPLQQPMDHHNSLRDILGGTSPSPSSPSSLPTLSGSPPSRRNEGLASNTYTSQTSGLSATTGDTEVAMLTGSSSMNRDHGSLLESPALSPFNSPRRRTSVNLSIGSASSNMWHRVDTRRLGMLQEEVTAAYRKVVFIFFLRLYGNFPWDFLHYLRSGCLENPNLADVLAPLLVRIRFHPDLVFPFADKDSHPETTKQSSPSSRIATSQSHQRNASSSTTSPTPQPRRLFDINNASDPSVFLEALSSFDDIQRLQVPLFMRDVKKQAVRPLRRRHHHQDFVTPRMNSRDGETEDFGLNTSATSTASAASLDSNPSAQRRSGLRINPFDDQQNEDANDSQQSKFEEVDYQEMAELATEYPIDFIPAELDAWIEACGIYDPLQPSTMTYDVVTEWEGVSRHPPLGSPSNGAGPVGADSAASPRSLASPIGSDDDGRYCVDNGCGCRGQIQMLKAELKMERHLRILNMNQNNGLHHSHKNGSSAASSSSRGGSNVNKLPKLSNSRHSSPNRLTRVLAEDTSADTSGIRGGMRESASHQSHLNIHDSPHQKDGGTNKYSPSSTKEHLTHGWQPLSAATIESVAASPVVAKLRELKLQIRESEGRYKIWEMEMMAKLEVEKDRRERADEESERSIREASKLRKELKRTQIENNSLRSSVTFLEERVKKLEKDHQILESREVDVAELTMQLEDLKVKYGHFVESSLGGVLYARDKAVDDKLKEMAVLRDELARCRAERESAVAMLNDEVRRGQDQSKSVTSLQQMMSYEQIATKAKLDAIQNKYLCVKKINGGLYQRIAELERALHPFLHSKGATSSSHTTADSSISITTTSQHQQQPMPALSLPPAGGVEVQPSPRDL